MTLQAVLKSRESLPYHHLFEVVNDLQAIESPADIGFHPDSVLSALDYFSIYPKNMPASGVRGEDFVAIRCAPEDDSTSVKVECVYLRYIDGKWKMRKLDQPVSHDEFEAFAKLAQNEPVKMGDRIWKRI